MNWKALQNDPNSREIQAARQNALVAARAPVLITNREEYLAEQARGKRVLDMAALPYS